MQPDRGGFQSDWCHVVASLAALTSLQVHSRVWRHCILHRAHGIGEKHHYANISTGLAQLRRNTTTPAAAVAAAAIKTAAKPLLLLSGWKGLTLLLIGTTAMCSVNVQCRAAGGRCNCCVCVLLLCLAREERQLCLYHRQLLLLCEGAIRCQGWCGGEGYTGHTQLMGP